MTYTGADHMVYRFHTEPPQTCARTAGHFLVQFNVGSIPGLHRFVSQVFDMDGKVKAKSELKHGWSLMSFRTNGECVDFTFASGRVQAAPNSACLVEPVEQLMVSECL